jgi:predicted nucleic acid-binding protein
VATLGAFFDANVLYPSGLRNFLMHLALTGLFRAHWSAEVHDEWIRNLLKNRPDLTAEKLARTRRLMDEAMPQALVTEYEHLIESVVLPDPDDRHVVAAAIRSGVGVIVTHNLPDFPDSVLSRFALEAQLPDDFVLALLDISADLVLEAARTEEYLSELGAQGLTKTMAALRQRVARIPGTSI